MVESAPVEYQKIIPEGEVTVDQFNPIVKYRLVTVPPHTPDGESIQELQSMAVTPDEKSAVLVSEFYTAPKGETFPLFYCKYVPTVTTPDYTNIPADLDDVTTRKLKAEADAIALRKDEQIARERNYDQNLTIFFHGSAGAFTEIPKEGKDIQTSVQKLKDNTPDNLSESDLAEIQQLSAAVDNGPETEDIQERMQAAVQNYKENPRVVDDPMYQSFGKSFAHDGTVMVVEQRSNVQEKIMERRRFAMEAEIHELRQQTQDISPKGRLLEEEKIRAKYHLDYRECSLEARTNDMVGFALSLMVDDHAPKKINLQFHSMFAYAGMRALKKIQQIAETEPTSDSEEVLHQRAQRFLDAIQCVTLIAPADYDPHTEAMPSVTSRGRNVRGAFWRKVKKQDLIDNSEMLRDIRDRKRFPYNICLIQAERDQVVTQEIRDPQLKAVQERITDEENEYGEGNARSRFVVVENSLHAGLLLPTNTTGPHGPIIREEAYKVMHEFDRVNLGKAA